MITINTTQSSDIRRCFQDQYDQYRAEGRLWSDFVGKMGKEFFDMMCGFELGAVEIGQIGDTYKEEYIIITTLAGKVMIYQDAIEGEIRYFLDEAYSKSKGKTYKDVPRTFKKIKDLEHIFNLADVCAAEV